jgi:hypothetical protein
MVVVVPRVVLRLYVGLRIHDVRCHPLLAGCYITLNLN